LRSTEYWPDWDEAILFFETSEAKPSPDLVDAILMDYENMGVFDRLKGLLVGRSMHYSPLEKERLREVVLERTANYSFPIVTDMDFGHTAPQFTLPMGCRARIDAHEKSFHILESAVAV
jgi:muramoyltetrapeptide carboxypeptidase LdcA involved in peptidoglycan recycling